MLICLLKMYKHNVHFVVHHSTNTPIHKDIYNVFQNAQFTIFQLMGFAIHNVQSAHILIHRISEK